MSYLAPSLPDTALLVIDIQKAFHHDIFSTRQRSTPNLQPNVTAILDGFRTKNLPVIHIHHIDTEKCDPKGESPWNEKVFGQKWVSPQDFVVPLAGELVLRKYDQSSAFNAVFVSDKKTGLKDVLDAQGIKTIILVGFSSPHCVSSTARGGYDAGYKVVVVADGSATFNTSVVTNYQGAVTGDAKEGKGWSAETVHAVAMAHLDGDLADVVGTEDVLKCF
ncbi:Isochorismatase-like protein [Mycena amicta]|nr:Isochorismatase-like protein [Mycena amicta]